MANNDIVIRIPTGAIMEPDNEQYEHRMKIRSESSNSLYLVARKKKTQRWCCSCPGWIRHRWCKHLAATGIPEQLSEGRNEKQLGKYR